MNKTQISNALRNSGLIHLGDWIRYYLFRFKNRKVNQEFKTRNPEVKLPPDYLIYEAFQLNYFKYYNESIDTAKWLAGYFSKYIELKDRKILDWGCGPGRVIRHMQGAIGNNCEYYGTDYNAKSIEWCRRNLPGINFNLNSLEPELPYADDFFDIIYGISIFTHLSEELHYSWYSELFRVLKPGGIMFLTMHGDNFRVILTRQERLKYEKGELVIRGKTKIGHRTFGAFHPESFVTKLFRGVQILEHVRTGPLKGRALPQDIWIIRKNPEAGKSMSSIHKE